MDATGLVTELFALTSNSQYAVKQYELVLEVVHCLTSYRH